MIRIILGFFKKRIALLIEVNGRIVQQVIGDVVICIKGGI